jgi:hypothetical protein
MREIPALQILCLRAVGSKSCSAEETFAADQQTGEPSQTSKLLRAFHQRPTVLRLSNDDDHDDDDVDNDGIVAAPGADKKTIQDIPISRIPCVGNAASRRPQANDVDLNHPIVAHHYQHSDSYPSNSKSKSSKEMTSTETLVMEFANPALDCLQAYIDSLVELGRMDDNRLGVHFFEEWKANVLMGAGKPVPPRSGTSTKPMETEGAIVDDTAASASEEPPPRKRSRRRSSTTPADDATNNNSRTSVATSTTLRVRLSKQGGPPPPLGSLSLNNCAVAEETIEAMRDSGMGVHIGVLDLTGIYQLTDAMIEQLLPHCPHLQRFSIKNCRRLTVASLQILAQYQTKLQFLDLGGTYNVSPDDVIDTIVVGKNNNKKNRPCPQLIELHVSGLGWNDHLMKTIVCGSSDEDEEMEENEQSIRPWKALSFGFSMNLTSLALRQSLSKVSSTLVSLALHFCEYLVDNALMGMLGRNLPQVRFLDVRGNSSLNSMTGWYDGRASAYRNPAAGSNNSILESIEQQQQQQQDGDEEEEGGVQELTVLARFSGITKASLEETVRIHPRLASKLTCILDSAGVGIGIYR